MTDVMSIRGAGVGRMRVMSEHLASLRPARCSR